MPFAQTNKSAIDIAKQYFAACEAKDFEKVTTLLHPNFTLRDPKMQFDNAREFIDFMRNCPFSGTFENVTFIGEGDKVVAVMDCKMTSPVVYSLRMCDIMTIHEGKIMAEETIFDTALIPKEVDDYMRQHEIRRKAA